MNSEDLLKDVIRATREREIGPEIVRVGTTSDLLEIAYCEEYQASSSNALSAEELYVWGMYSEVFEEIAHHYWQICLVAEVGFNRKKLIKHETKLHDLIKVIENGFPQAKSSLYSFFQSNEPYTLSALVYCLSSIQCQQNDTQALDRVLIELAKTEDEFLSTYVGGLRHGLNPTISNRLIFLLELADPEVQSACMDVLLFRNDLTPGFTESLGTHENLLVRIKAALFQTYHGDPENYRACWNTIEMIPPMFLETFFVDGLRFDPGYTCTKLRKIIDGLIEDAHDPAPISIAGIKSMLKIIPLIARKQDAQWVISLFDDNHDHDPEVRLAVIDAMAGLGVIACIDRLITALSTLTEDDEELRNATDDGLKKITGVNFEEALQNNIEIDEWGITREINESLLADCWTGWWHRNRIHFLDDESAQINRWRLGKRLDFTVLVDSLQHPNVSLSDRKQAYLELTIRAGINIPFEPDWPIKQQEAAFDKLRQAITEYNGRPQTWLFNGSQQNESLNNSKGQIG